MASFSTILGADPGMTGGIAILFGNDIVAVFHIPLANDGSVDSETLYNMIRASYIPNHTIAYVEKVWGFSKGSIAIAKLNYVAGVIDGVLGSLNIPIVKVAPATWRKGLFGNYRAKKQDAIDFCTEHHPNLGITDHNLAESICLAKYGWKNETKNL